MPKAKLTIYLLVFLFSFQAYGQEFTNDAGEREKLFISKVKMIDEFFERFNDNPNSSIREIYKKKNIPFNIPRKKLIASLFNYEGKTWSKSEIDSFIAKALLTKMPTGENWYGDGWFAEVTCRFQYKNAEINIPLILKVETDEKNRSRWMITGIKPNQLEEPIDAVNSIVIRKIKKHFISPSSHGADFIELTNIFSDKENLTDYFENDFFSDNNGVRFYQSVLKGKLVFLYAKPAKFYFLNVENYIFQVEYFNRELLNAGWLINKIQIASKKDKEDYKKQLLQK
ncbi:MAG: hypothetical protein ABIN36_12265 [Ferruginibacter sp.]